MKTFLKLDFFLQSLLVIPTLLCAVSFVGFVFALFGMFFVGLWQLISCIAHLIAKRDNGWRKRHLLISVVGLSLAGLLTVVSDQYYFGDFLTGITILFGIGFLGLACYYYYKTYKEFRNRDLAPLSSNYHEDLLDYDEVVK